MSFYERRPAGVLISRLTNDVEALEQMVTDAVTTLFQASLTLVGSIVILLAFDVELALLTFLIFPVLAVLFSGHDMYRLGLVLGLYALIVVIDQLVLQPLILKRVTRIPIWASILVPIAMGIIIPFWGVLLAPPLLAVVYAFKGSGTGLNE